MSWIKNILFVCTTWVVLLSIPGMVEAQSDPLAGKPELKALFASFDPVLLGEVEGYGPKEPGMNVSSEAVACMYRQRKSLRTHYPSRPSIWRDARSHLNCTAEHHMRIQRGEVPRMQKAVPLILMSCSRIESLSRSPGQFPEAYRAITGQDPDAPKPAEKKTEKPKTETIVISNQEFKETLAALYGSDSEEPEASGKSPQNSASTKNGSRHGGLPPGFTLIRMDEKEAVLYVSRTEGADWRQLRHSFLAKDYETEDVASLLSSNPAKTTIPFCRKDGRNRFYKKRWSPEKDFLEKPGSEAYAYYLEICSEESRGFALQGGQRFTLPAKKKVGETATKAETEKPEKPKSSSVAISSEVNEKPKPVKTAEIPTETIIPAGPMLPETSRPKAPNPKRSVGCCCEVAKNHGSETWIVMMILAPIGILLARRKSRRPGNKNRRAIQAPPDIP